jgi:hypothetical protein
MIRRSGQLSRRSNWKSGLAFSKAAIALDRDSEWRQKYFDSPLQFGAEAHDHFVSSKKKELLKNPHYSVAFKKDLVAGFIKPRENSAIVFPIVDQTCPETDAARYLRGLKRGVITAPTNIADLKEWIMSGNKKYQEYCRLTGKKPTLEDFQSWESRREYQEYCQLTGKKPTFESWKSRRR